jgi:hypothetical protein
VDRLKSSARNVLSSRRAIKEFVGKAYMSGVRKAFRQVKDKVEDLKEREFIKAYFNDSATRSKINSLQKKAVEDLENIVIEVFAQSYGESAERIQDRINKIGITRSNALVQVAVIKAHAEGVLDALQRLGIEEVGVDVEWTTTNNPCSLCEPLRGVILTIEQARGLFPRHVNCRCSPIPSFRKYSAYKLRQAIRKSVRQDDYSDWGLSFVGNQSDKIEFINPYNLGGN